MTKKIKKLEKETTVYRSRWESSNKALLEMAEEVSGQLWVWLWPFPLSFSQSLTPNTRSVAASPGAFIQCTFFKSLHIF